MSNKNNILINLSLLIPLMIISHTTLAVPRFPAPPDVKITLIGDNMIINGVPTDIRIIDTHKSVAHVLDYYRRYWPKGTPKEPGYTETDAMPPWIILSRAEENYLMTVQVQPAGKGTTGYLAMSRLPESTDNSTLGKGFPKVSGSRVFSDITSDDANKKGRTLNLINKQSVPRNVAFYRDHYSRQGWVTEMDKGADKYGHAFRFRSGRESVSLVINHSEKGTYVAAQIVKEDLF